MSGSVSSLANNRDAVAGLLVASAAVLLPLVLMVYQLALFHLTLLRRGQTTYEFIVSEQKRARDRAEARKQSARAGERGGGASGEESSARSYRSGENDSRAVNSQRSGVSAAPVEEKNDLELSHLGP